MQISDKVITDMRRHIDACSKYIDALAKGYRSPEKVNTLLDAAMNQVELCCIDLRQLCEKTRSPIQNINLDNANYYHSEISGTVTKMDNGWLDIRLNALLPHCKTVGSTKYVSDTITRLLDHFCASGGELPMFDKAYLAIVEHCNKDCSGAFDHDNKGYKGVINTLKGRLFPDDDKFELSLGLFTVIDEDVCCHVYVTPYEEAGDLLYQMSAEMF